MIAFLRGILRARSLDHAVVEVAGIGYHLAMSMNSISALGSVGDEVLVHTQMVVRENDLSLIGFADEVERDVFLRLVEVSGIGPKGALAVLSSLTPAALAVAVATDDIALVSTAPGVGKKTAQRIIIELKDRLSMVGTASLPTGAGAGGRTEPSGESVGHAEPGDSGSAELTALSDARAALSAMGFTPAEIADALRGSGAGATAQQLIAAALKHLGGGR